MSQTQYTYSIATDTANAVLAVDSLKIEYESSSIVTALDYITSIGDVLNIFTKDVLSASDEATLNALVAAHTGVPQSDGPAAVEIVDKDGDTGAIKVTNNFAPNNFYQRLHEIEFTTSTVGGAIHDKDINNIDTGWSSVKHYKNVSGTETLMVNPTQADLDTECIRTDFEFMPNVDYMIKSGTIAHDSIPSSEIYVWAKMLDTDPTLHSSGILPITVLDGGLAMSFVGPKTPVGLKGVNGSLLFYDGVNTENGKVTTPAGLGTNRITYVLRHQAGMKHKFQSIFEIFRMP